MALATSRLARRRSPGAGDQDGSHRPKRQVTISQENGHFRKSRTEVAVESTNFYATNFELGAIPPSFIHQLSRSRWRIDAEVFQTITTDCHLKHPAVHQSTALVVLTMIRLLAYALSSVFYQRQICSHTRGACDSFHALRAVSTALPMSLPTPLLPYSFRPTKINGERHLSRPLGLPSQQR